MPRYINCDNSIDPAMFSGNDSRRFATARYTDNAELLEIFAYDPVPVVRDGVAINENTPEDILKILAEDADLQVKLHVADNPSASKEILTTLANDADAQLAVVIVQNPNCPESLRSQLIDNFKISTCISIDVDQQISDGDTTKHIKAIRDGVQQACWDWGFDVSVSWDRVDQEDTWITFRLYIDADFIQRPIAESLLSEIETLLTDVYNCGPIDEDIQYDC